MKKEMKLVRPSDIRALIVWPDDCPYDHVQGFVVKAILIEEDRDNHKNQDRMFLADERIVNLWSAKAESLFATISEIFPHLKYNGNSTDLDSGEVFDCWHFFTDDVGFKHIADQKEELGYTIKEYSNRLYAVDN